ncbi:MAG: EndoU domain-containing protein [Sphingosinicella sp.]|nr:EndoU domain-containing protein [Sphingosinicella sp.]
MRQLIDDRDMGRVESNSVHSARFTILERSVSILGNTLLGFLALCFILVGAPQAAFAQTAEGFLGWTSDARPDGYFPTAEAACRAQWVYYQSGSPNSRFIGAKPSADDPNTQKCEWTRFQYLCGPETGGGIGGCGTIIPVGATFRCATGYTRQLGTYCTKDLLPERQCKSSFGSSLFPTVGNPIALLSGAKLAKATDFATADGKFVISRSYRSIPFGRSVNATAFTRGLAGNWNFDFSYELKIGAFSGSPGTPNAKMAVLAPDGTAYDFVLQSNGIWTADTSTGAFFAHKDLKLEYVGTLPADLATIRSSSSQWRLTDGKDVVWTFQTFRHPNGSTYHVGRPTSRTDRDGYRWDFTYRSDTGLEKITDSHGRQALFNWSNFYVTTLASPPAGSHPYPEAVKSISLPDGTAIRYTFDPPAAAAAPSTGVVERLIKAERLNASAAVVDSTTYAYADVRHPRHITSITDHRGVQTATYAYDARGRGTSTAGGGGADTYTVEYNETATEWTRRVTNPLGKAAVFHFTSFGTGDLRLTQIEGEASTNCPISARSITYGPDKAIATETDEEGRVTSYARDAVGRPTAITEAFGTPLARTTNYSWASGLNAPAEIVKPGLTESRIYSSGQLTNVTLTDTTNITIPYPTNGRTRGWTYDWSPGGLLNSVDGPLPGEADKVRFTYDTAGYLTRSIDEVDNVTEVTVRDNRGAPLTIADPNGVPTLFIYDALGRPTSVKTNPGPSQSLYTMEYDNAGNLKKVTMPLGGWLSYTYDAASRVTRIDNDRGEYQTFVLNGLGEATGETTRDSSAAITRQRTKVYDELGRIIQSIGAGTQAAFQYDKVDNLVQTTDGRSKSWGTGWDALNRVVTETDPTTAQSQSAYASNDALTQFKDGRNVTTSRVVDGFGDTIYETSPDRGDRTYWYDQAGRLAKVLAPDDAAGLPDESVGYVYDSTIAGNKGAGRLTSATDQSGSSAFAYDEQGRLIAEQKAIQAQAYQVGYAYDKNGALTSITYPSGHVVTYDRANDGRVTQVRSQVIGGGASTNLATSIAYSPFGPLKGLTYGNGLALARSYDQNYWLTGITLTGASAPLLDLAFGRDGNGNVTGVTDNAATSRAASFTYAANDRLQTAVGAWGADAYTWDASGNRTRVDRTVGGTTASDVATIPAGTNRLTEIRDGAGTLSKAFTLRDGGDLAQQNVAGGYQFDYVYSPRKRLAAVKTNGTEVASYLYDHAGHRVVRTLPATSQVIHYIYGQDGQLLADHDGVTGAMLKEYVWLDDMPLAQIGGPVATPTYAFVHTGQIGEPLMVTDASQAKIWDVVSDPWGNALPLSPASIAQDLRLPGQFMQGESGLYQNWMRDYDPSLGRYIQSDPIGLAGGSNLFAYANGNPNKYIDPNGLFGTGSALRLGRLLCVNPVLCVAGGAAVAAYLVYHYYNSPLAHQIQCEWLGLPPRGPLSLPDRGRGGNYSPFPPTHVSSSASNGDNGPADGDQNDDLTDDKGKDHILNGDETGGGHRAGTGRPGKSEFPSTWSDQDILEAISDVATDPTADRKVEGGRNISEDTRNGVDIRTVDDGGRIVTGYGTNLPRNPRQ